MAKHDRILRLFPWVVSTEPLSLMRQVCAALAGPLEEADSLMFEIQRAHRIRVAESSLDILRLAASLNLDAAHFADLVERYAPESAALLGAMRRRVGRVAALHLDGLGTPWAVTEAAAIMLDAEIQPARGSNRPLAALDAEGYSQVGELTRAFSKPAPAGRIYLHENPRRRRSVPATERRHLDAWFIASENVEPAPAAITIEGIGSRTVMPTVFCPSTGESVRFHGIVPAGARLTFHPKDGARLDGRPVDQWISADVGARADFSEWNDDHLIVERFGDPPPFAGDLSALVSAPYRRLRPAPSLPPGNTEWRVGVTEGVWNRALMDFAVFAFPTAPPGRCDEGAGFDASVFDYEPSARVGMAWSERIPCAFKLLVPSALPVEKPAEAKGAEPGPAATPGQPSAAARRAGAASATEPQAELGPIAAFVNRCKAAGVAAYLDVTREEWILGRGILRTSEAQPPAAPPEHTVLRPEGFDLFIPIDPSAPVASP